MITTPQPSVTSEMVERIGEALRKECRAEFGSDWCYDVAWRFARAAITTMREPTEAMILAGVHHDNMGDMAGRWRAMIDAALANPQAPLVSSEGDGA